MINKLKILTKMHILQKFCYIQNCTETIKCFDNQKIPMGVKKIQSLMYSNSQHFDHQQVSSITSCMILIVSCENQ